MWCSRVIRWLVACGAIAWSACALADGADDVRAKAQSGDYRGALQLVNRRLAEARGNAELRYELLMLRGECLVQLRQKPAAIEAFRSASRAVSVDSDFEKTLAARAQVEVLTGSEGWTFRAAGERVDIIDPQSRGKAMGVMFSERLLDLTPRIEKARDAAVLGPMIDLLPSIAGLMALEHGASGKTERTTPIFESFGERGRELITAELIRLEGRIGQLEDLANELIILRDGEIITRRGLHSNEQAELRDAVAYLDKIEQAADEGRRISRRLGGTGEKWDDIILTTGRLAGRIRAIFETLDVRVGQPAR